MKKIMAGIVLSFALLAGSLAFGTSAVQAADGGSYDLRVNTYCVDQSVGVDLILTNNFDHSIYADRTDPNNLTEVLPGQTMVMGYVDGKVVRETSYYINVDGFGAAVQRTIKFRPPVVCASNGRGQGPK